MLGMRWRRKGRSGGEWDALEVQGRGEWYAFETSLTSWGVGDVLEPRGVREVLKVIGDAMEASLKGKCGCLSTPCPSHGRR